METILITGYNGFIGSHLINSLSSKYCLVGVSSKQSNEKNILRLKKDIRKLDTKDLPRKIDCIVHLAALTDVNYCENHQKQCFGINLLGTQKMLEIARKLDSKFVFLSTSHVYGKPKKLPILEDHEKNPKSTYSISKHGAEVLCETYSKTYGMDVSIPRLFSVYGPKSPEHLVTTRIILQILKQKNVKLGSLSPKRDFIYISDAIDAISLLIKKTRDFNTYNIGTGKSYSILNICNLLKKISGKTFTIKSVKTFLRKDEIQNIVSNPRKIMKLGWKPKISIEKGFEQTYDWYQSKLN